MFWKFFMVVIGTILFIFHLEGNVSAKTLGNDPLNLQVERVQIQANSISSALSKAASIYGIPIGFEPELQPQRLNSKKVELHLTNATLKEVLDILINPNSGYEWKLVDDVINVYPKQSRDDVVREILDTKIASFTLEKGTRKIDVGNAITSIVIVNRKLETFGVTAFHFSSAMSGLEEINPRKELQFNDVTVREILNQIAKESPSKFWSIARWGSNNELLTISL